MAVNRKLTPKGTRDYKLVKDALDKGSQKAFSELMGLYWDTIYFMLLKMTGNREDAEDLTIEAFGKAFRFLPQYAPDYAFSTWLFKIASNHCIDFIRKKKKNILSYEGNEELGDPDSRVILAGDLDSPEGELIRGQRIRHMRQVVSRLKPRYQDLIRLRYFEEKSYEEICEELDLPLGTVKAQLFRAREFLFNILKNTQDNF